MKTTKIENFTGFNFEIKAEPIIEENAKECAERLKTEPKWKRNRKTKTYNEGWNYDMYDKGTKEVSAVVKNKTNWQLTWLLENGHLIVNKKGGVGYASGTHHIKNAFDKQAKQFVKDMKDVEIVSK